MICATTTLSKSAPRFWTPSISTPDIVSNSANASMLGDNSTNSRSQLTENFIWLFVIPNERSAVEESLWRYLCPFATGSLHFAPDDGKGSCELPQKTQIILRKQADVGNVEQHHRQPVHSETESEPGPFFRIISVVTARLIDCFENGGMHHAAAADFDPLFAALQRTRFHVNLKTRFGEGKIMRAKTHRRVCTEKFAQERFQRAFQFRDADIFIHVRNFDLMTLRALTGVDLIAPVSRARGDDANGWRR